MREQAGHSREPSLVGASLPLQKRHSRVYPAPRFDPVACLKNLIVLLNKELDVFFFRLFCLLVVALTEVLVIEEGVVVVKLYSLTSRLASICKHTSKQEGGGGGESMFCGRYLLGWLVSGGIFPMAVVANGATHAVFSVKRCSTSEIFLEAVR